MNCEPALWQKLDGTVLRHTTPDQWEYLSPLFGEWITCLTPTPIEVFHYPRNLEIAPDVLYAAALLIKHPDREAG